MENAFDQPDNSNKCYGARIAYGKRPVPMTPSRAAKLKVHQDENWIYNPEFVSATNYEAF